MANDDKQLIENQQTRAAADSYTAEVREVPESIAKFIEGKHSEISLIVNLDLEKMEV
jgi:hypothetical protein